MKTYYTIKSLLTFAAIALFAACSQEDVNNDLATASAVKVSITANNFESADPDTRSSESGYRTYFTNGDAVGITVVDAYSNIVQNNLKYVFNGSSFVPEGTPVTAYNGASYIAYYPYSAAMAGKKTTAEIVAAFTPKTDQSSYANYAASDLMTANGQLSGANNLSFTLDHAMSLVIITLDGQAYKYGNGNGTAFTKPSIWRSLDINGTSVRPWQNNDTYRYITKPGNTLIGGTFTTATPSGRVIDYSKTMSLAADRYYRLKATYAEASIPIDTDPVTIDVSIENPIPASGLVWSYDINAKIYTLSGNATLIGQTQVNKVAFAPGTTAKITIDGIDITAYPAIDVTDASVVLSLQSQNATNSIFVPEGSSLTIRGDGMLTASSTEDGAAGIGSATNEPGGTITIESGTVVAQGANEAAGIGAGSHADGGIILIKGGTITATGGAGGAGIGGSEEGDAGTINLFGGSVKTYGGAEAAGIGGGHNGDAGTITISGGVIASTGGANGGVAIGPGVNLGQVIPANLTLPSAYNWWYKPDLALPEVQGTNADVADIQTFPYVYIDSL